LRLAFWVGLRPHVSAVLSLPLIERGPTLSLAIKRWWREQRQDANFFAAAHQLIAIGFEFLRDSLPDRKRQRYGDVDYDWEYRVNTTSANVDWRARLMGVLNSSYQPIEPELFRAIMNSLSVDFSQFTFVDIGSGKGRALLLASEYAFRRVLGIELLPELDAIAQENIRKFSGQHLGCGTIEAVCGDATEFVFPQGPLVILLNNPLPQAGLRKLISNVESSLREEQRPVFVIYANPVLEQVLSGRPIFRKVAGTHQYAVFRSET
jgi:SAM-dependent methyltransferase